MNPTPRPGSDPAAPAPAIRPPNPGEQPYGWNPPPPPGWAPPPGQQLPPGWVPPPGAYLPAPPPVAPNGQPLANFGDRFLAFLLDYVIYYAVVMLLSLPLYFWWFFSFLGTVQEAADQPYDPYGGSALEPGEFFGDFFLPMIGMMAGLMLLSFLFSYLYFVEFQLRSGQTIGKKTMKLKIIPIDQAAGPVTRSELVKRWAVEWVAGSFVPGLFYLDGLWQLWDKPFQQCLHDKAAKTVVVKVG